MYTHGCTYCTPPRSGVHVPSEGRGGVGAWAVWVGGVGCTTLVGVAYTSLLAHPLCGLVPVSTLTLTSMGWHNIRDTDLSHPVSLRAGWLLVHVFRDLQRVPVEQRRDHVPYSIKLNHRRLHLLLWHTGRRR